MSASEQDIAANMARFIAMLDISFKGLGVHGGLPPALRDAVQAVPRHRFVHRFRVDKGPLENFRQDPARHLPTIYSDAVLRHVDAAGEPLASTNSQPSYILYLLHLLDIQPNQSVLEIGSGSGWLAAVMAHLVGRDGAVTGIEILQDLAQQSRVDLASLGCDNVTIVTGDGVKGHAAGAPFGRAIITAATWDLPAVLFEQVAEGGAVLVPIEMRDGAECQVTRLRRHNNRFKAERSVPGWFVPLVGPTQSRANSHRTLESLPFWHTISSSPARRYKLALGALHGFAAAPAAKQFRSFLGRTEPGLVIADKRVDNAQADGPAVERFGLFDEADASVALCGAGEVLGYGGPSAMRRLARAFERWAAYGMPGMAAFELEVVRAADAPLVADPVTAANVWVESRGATALVWRLPSDAMSWRKLLRGKAAGGPNRTAP